VSILSNLNYFSKKTQLTAVGNLVHLQFSVLSTNLLLHTFSSPTVYNSIY